MKKICTNCNSNDILTNIPIADYSEGVSYELAIEIHQDPSAIFFKNTKRHKLKANVCANCGSVDLHILNPKQFKADYLKANRK